MKKTTMTIIVLLACMIIIPLSLAEIRSKVDTVANAKEMEDDVRVTLEGFIVEKVDKETYLFKDDTGEIDVEIQDDLWEDMEMDPESKVMIRGEIDKEDDSVKLEAKKLKSVE